MGVTWLDNRPGALQHRLGALDTSRKRLDTADSGRLSSWGTVCVVSHETGVCLRRKTEEPTRREMSSVRGICDYLYDDEKLKQSMLAYLRAMQGRDPRLDIHESHFIAVDTVGNRIVANHATFVEVAEDLKQRNIEGALVMKVPSGISEELGRLEGKRTTSSSQPSLRTAPTQPRNRHDFSFKDRLSYGPQDFGPMFDTLPIVWVTLPASRTRVFALFDTGCDISLLTYDYAAGVGILNVAAGQKATLRGLSGELEGYIHEEVSLILKDRLIRCPVFFIERHPLDARGVPLILGRDCVLEELGPVAFHETKDGAKHVYLS